MAIVTGFEKVTVKKPRVHPTEVVGYWSILPDQGSGSILQIDTVGSKDRELPGKQSQTLQLTTNSARELYQILKAEFQF
jgi:hypothetical protein